MEKIFENIEGNKFKLISESITEDEPKSSLIRKGLKKVFSEGEKEYSYKRLQNLGMGYIRDVEEAKKCALQEARELASEYGYEDQEEEQKFVKEDGYDETDTSNAEEKREVQIGTEIKNLAGSLSIGPANPYAKHIQKIIKLADELINIHSPDGPVVKPGTGPKALYKRGSIY